MKRKNKVMLGMLTLPVIMAPIAIAISCSSSDEEKIDLSNLDTQSALSTFYEKIKQNVSTDGTLKNTLIFTVNGEDFELTKGATMEQLQNVSWRLGIAIGSNGLIRNPQATSKIKHLYFDWVSTQSALRIFQNTVMQNTNIDGTYRNTIIVHLGAKQYVFSNNLTIAEIQRRAYNLGLALGARNI